MKVTRLKRGYRLNLSPGEYEALQHLHGIAIAGGTLPRFNLSNAGVRGLNKLRQPGAFDCKES